jgi:hypothetical protein
VEKETRIAYEVLFGKSAGKFHVVNPQIHASQANTLLEFG